MNKGDLITKMATDASISKSQATMALNSFMTATSGALRKGEKVTLVGFGTFGISKRSARKGRNPQTGKVIQIAARKVVRFKAGTELSKKVK
jgi:DNA-binding protein HU-beta